MNITLEINQQLLCHLDLHTTTEDAVRVWTDGSTADNTFFGFHESLKCQNSQGQERNLKVFLKVMSLLMADKVTIIMVLLTSLSSSL